MKIIIIVDNSHNLTRILKPFDLSTEISAKIYLRKKIL